MVGLSSDIEDAIEDSLSGMLLDVDMLKVDDVKLATLVKSRIDSFTAIKLLLVTWQNSPNAPSHEKLKSYIIELVQVGEMSVEVLRQALKKKIDFATLEPEKYGSAISSKPIILKAISEIDAGNKELKLQIEVDKFDLGERDFKRGFPEKYANQEFYPLKNYYKEWYDEETQSIMICPKGTKGEVIVLDGLKIMLPKKPRNTDIMFHRKPKLEQYWIRPEIPKGLTPDTEEAFTDYILEEFRRRREGLWFMNNGEAVYITPAHYMGLMWNEMLETGGYKEFRMAQANMYYFAKACLVDPRSVGMFFTKGRRTGFTELAIDHIVDLSTCTRNAKCGITSKSEKDAISVFLKYQHCVLNLPFFFIPVVKGKIDDVKKMVFGKPSDNTKANKKLKETTTKDYLNTTVDFRATATLAYDSNKLTMYLSDESAKWERPNNIEDHWANVKPTMVQGGRIVGKTFMGSTLNPKDKGGSQFQTLEQGSNVLKRTNNDRTVTGLYSYFLPAHFNMENYTDRYGVCHTTLAEGEFFYNAQGIKTTIGSLQYLLNEFQGAKILGDKYYWNARRLDPITKQDAFRDEAVDSSFDQQKINDQLDYNYDYDIKKQLVRGNFSWENGIKDTRVIWTPMERGRFLLSWIPNEIDFKSNQFEMRRNIFGGSSFHPLNDDIGCLGADNYDMNSTNESILENTENGLEHSGGSRGALSGVTGTTMQNVPSNYFFLEYLTRPEEAEIFYEDALMACVFYGMPILIENNKPRMLHHFKNRGYRGFSLTRFDKHISKISPEEKLLGGIPSASQDVITSHATVIESYILKYVGKYTQSQSTIAIREEGQIGSMPFDRTLKDWSKFNISKREKFDITIASGYALMGLKRKSYAPKEKENKTIVIKLQRFTYN
jgi:hypothetical protein